MEISSLHNTHEEADCKMIFHLSRIKEGNIVIKSADIDVLILLLGNIELIKANIWMMVDRISRNDLRMINVGTIAAKLGLKLAKCLPAFDALTGSDYTAAFHKVGKIKPFKLLDWIRMYQLLRWYLGIG